MEEKEEHEDEKDAMNGMRAQRGGHVQSWPFLVFLNVAVAPAWKTAGNRLRLHDSSAPETPRCELDCFKCTAFQWSALMSYIVGYGSLCNHGCLIDIGQRSEF